MGMSEFYGPADEAESIATLEHAIERGITFLDTANVYGVGHNEELIGRVIKGRRNQLFIGTKFGIVRDSEGGFHGVNGRPEYLRSECEKSLKRLGTDVIDLYYQHRGDPDVPIEETVGAMAELVREGKVRYLGLSEADAATIRRAHAVHPIAALQSEYSLWTRDLDAEILPTLRELGIGLVPYSPLGRGFLTGGITGNTEFAADDYRLGQPRFQGDNLQRNLALVEAVRSIAQRKGCTPAQLALAWVLAQGDDVVPIPGTKRRKYLDDNIGALDVRLTAAERAEIEAIFAPEKVAGPREPEQAVWVEE
jgi:aryl-alcohol dehydrogenase-like predicted oxidoreductase